MDRQSLAGDDPPPTYTLEPSTPLVPPAPQGSSSRQTPRDSHQVDTESRSPPPPPPLPPPQVLHQTEQPTKDPAPSSRADPPTAPAGVSLSASSPSSRSSGFLSFRPNWLRNWSEEAAARKKEQAEAKSAAEEARQKAAAKARKKAAEKQALAEQKKRERRKTREQMQDRLRALISQVSLSEEEIKSALQSCARKCAAKDIDFAALLQKPILSDHLPVYWAILKRPAAAMQQVQGEEDDTNHGRGDPDALVLAILDYSWPLGLASVVAVRRACMAVSDNALFRRLCGLFLPVSSTDSMLLEGSGPQDNVVVEERSSNDGAFFARIKLAQFRLRMCLSKQVCVEFIARDRMWCLTFSADASSVDDAPDGTFSLGQQRAFWSSVNRPWVVTLKLGEHSSPTQVYAWLVVKRKSPVPTESEQSSSSIFIPLESQMRKLRPRRRHIGAILDKSVTGTDLPDGLSSCVDASGVLNMRFEAKLVLPTAPHTAP